MPESGDTPFLRIESFTGIKPYPLHPGHTTSVEQYRDDQNVVHTDLLESAKTILARPGTLMGGNLHRDPVATLFPAGWRGDGEDIKQPRFCIEADVDGSTRTCYPASVPRRPFQRQRLTSHNSQSLSTTGAPSNCEEALPSYQDSQFHAGQSTGSTQIAGKGDRDWKETKGDSKI
jgi:hypothetical protein